MKRELILLGCHIYGFIYYWIILDPPSELACGS